MEKLNMEMSLIESILFLENEPIDIGSIVKKTQLDRHIVKESINNLIKKYEEDFHGIEIILIGNGYTFQPKKKLWDFLKENYGKRNEKKFFVY